MLSNWEQVEKATKAAYESEGTAAKENEIYMNSLQGKLDSLKAVWQTFSADFLNSSFLKGIVSGATELLNVLDKIQNSIGTLGMVGATGGLIAFIQNLDKLKTIGDIFDATKIIKNNLNDFSAMTAGLDAFSASTVAAAASSAGLDAANTAAIFTSAELSATMAASAMATAGYDASLTAATLSHMHFTDAEIASAMALAGYDAEATAAAIANVNLGATATGAATGFGALATSIMGAVKGLLVFLATNPVGWAILAGGAIFGIAKAVNYVGEAIDRAAEKSKNANQEYESAKSEVEGIKSSQEGLKTQLNELAGKYNIEVSDNDTIDTLIAKLNKVGNMDSSDSVTLGNIEKQNEMLETQLSIKQKLMDYEKQNSANAAKEVFETTVRQATGELDRMGDPIYKRENILETTRRKQEALNEADAEYLEVQKQLDATRVEYSKWYQKDTEYEKLLRRSNNLEKERIALTGEISDNMSVIGENYQYLLDENGNPLKGFEVVASDVVRLINDINGVKEATDEASESVEEMEQGYVSSFSNVSQTATGFKTNLDSITEAINSQATGKSISLDTYNSEALKSYSSALEYHNGVMQYNLDKVKEITKAKYEEEKANIANGKAMDQEQYLENARKIQELREKQSKTTGQEWSYYQSEIEALLQSNATLVDNCKQWDVLSSSIEQATSRYQNWLNAQNASQSGEMFDSSLSAFKKINDTLNKSDSDDYGRVGNADYKVAVEFIVPDKVSEQGEAAIQSYMESVKKYLNFNENGEADSMNIQQFCQDALDKGLMQISKDGQSYEIAGKQTMEQFADGMGLALPLVQAMFGEMEEFGAEFDWSDEAVKSFGDLAMKANESAEALRGIDAFKDMHLVLDVSEWEDKASAVSTLKDEIKQMQDFQATLSVDSSEYQQASDVIQYLVIEKQILEQPAIMDVDTSQVSGKIGEAISLLQQYQQQKNEIEILQSVGADTSQAEAKLAELQGKIASSDAMATVGLKIDESQDIGAQIDSKIAGLDKEALINLKIDKTAFTDFNPEDKDVNVNVHLNDGGTKDFMAIVQDINKSVNFELNDGGTRDFIAGVTNLSRTITYTYQTIGSPPQGAHSVNGTAHASGTAYANGNWGTAPGGETLVGELGKSLPKRNYIG